MNSITRLLTATKHFLLLALTTTFLAPLTSVAQNNNKQIEQTTARFRGLQFVRPVNYRQMSRQQFVQWSRKQIRDQYSADMIINTSRSMALMGLIPEGTNIEQVYLKLIGQSAAAFYDFKTQAVYTFPGQRNPPTLMAHELTHALQDQNFHYGKFPEHKMKDNDDRQRALQCLLEGDATLIMPMVQSGKKGIGPTMAPARRTGPDSFLFNQLIFSYSTGTTFVKALYGRTNNWDLVNRAYRDLPRSTEQIFHPEKHFDPARRDDPKEIVTPNLESADWKKIDSNVMGEFGLRELFFIYLAANSPNRATTCAEGWGGDRYAVYAYKPAKAAALRDPIALWWITSWDTEQDAEEFFKAMIEVYQKRYTGLQKGVSDGTVGIVLKNTNWSIRILRKGDAVSIVHAPARLFADFAAAADKSAK